MKVMSPQDLRFYSEAIFGNRWQSNLAEELGVDRRRVNDYLNNKGKLSDSLVEEIERLLHEKKAEINLAIQTFEKNYSRK